MAKTITSTINESKVSVKGINMDTETIETVTVTAPRGWTLEKGLKGLDFTAYENFAPAKVMSVDEISTKYALDYPDFIHHSTVAEQKPDGTFIRPAGSIFRTVKSAVCLWHCFRIAEDGTWTHVAVEKPFDRSRTARQQMPNNTKDILFTGYHEIRDGKTEGRYITAEDFMKYAHVCTGTETEDESEA